MRQRQVFRRLKSSMRSSNLRVTCIFLLFAAIYYLVPRSRKDSIVLAAFSSDNPLYEPKGILNFARHLILTCPSAYYDIPDGSQQLGAEEITSPNVHSILASMSRVLVISSAESCRLQGIKKATCLLGKKIDSCVPDSLKTLVDGHGYAVSVTHASALALAIFRGYDSVAMIEDDAFFAEMPTDTLSSFQRLLETRDWNIVRMGFRPYFLEARGDGIEYSCPEQCKCEESQVIGTGLCKINEGGCDLRSADFYLAQHSIFEDLILKMLDASVFNRVIDFHVLQSFKDYWVAVPQISFQEKLEMPYPISLQRGFGDLFEELCVLKYKT